MRNTLAFLVAISATMLISDQESFIVKKTKQVVGSVVLSYQDQWCDSYAQLLQLFADLDIEKSLIQKNGIAEIMHSVQSEGDVFIEHLSKKEQQEALHALKKVTEQVQSAIKACKAYNKDIDGAITRSRKTKK